MLDNQPEIHLLAQHKNLKVLAVRGLAGQIMPTHHCDHDAFVVVEQGEVRLVIDGQPEHLTLAKSFLIPAGQQHHLELIQDSELRVVTALNAEIRFV